MEIDPTLFVYDIS